MHKKTLPEKNIEKANLLKNLAAKAAIEYIEPGMTIGLGTGSTVNFLIDNHLVKIKSKIGRVISSSLQSTEKLNSIGIKTDSLNQINSIDLYIDGADEANKNRQLIKGKGGALTCEKICRACSKKFICIVDSSKYVTTLGENLPIPIEVIPMARSYVIRQISKIGGKGVYRNNYITDSNNEIIDAWNLSINNTNAQGLEAALNNIPGVVESGIFAKHPADLLIIAQSSSNVIKI